MSANTIMLLFPELDPITRLAFPAILRFAAEAYASSHPLGDRPNNIRAELFMVGVNRVLVKEGVRFGMNRPSGSVTAMGQSVRQVGWKVKSPYVWENHLGEEILLNVGSPARMLWMLKNAVTWQLEQEFCNEVAKVDLCPDRDKDDIMMFGADWRTMRRAVHSKKLA